MTGSCCVRTEILWESEKASDAEARAMEAQLIQELHANDPAVGSNPLAKASNTMILAGWRTAFELSLELGTVSPAVMRSLSLIPADFDAGNRVAWSIIRSESAGSSDAISVPVDSASPHTLRSSRPCRPAG